jgi:hypothetical protein
MRNDESGAGRGPRAAALLHSISSPLVGAFEGNRKQIIALK